MLDDNLCGGRLVADLALGMGHNVAVCGTALQCRSL